MPSSVVLCCLMLYCVVLCCTMLSYVLKQLLATRVLLCLVLSNVALCCLMLSYDVSCSPKLPNNCWQHVFRIVLNCLI